MQEVLCLNIYEELYGYHCCWSVLTITATTITETTKIICFAQKFQFRLSLQPNSRYHRNH